MTQEHGFELITETHVAEINAIARLYKHVKSGAELLSIINDDENKVFGITFRTPPKTSNGIAHIMEHSVLCGSAKYQVKEPFIELVKGSLKTFVNAFTYPDRTCYPVASQNVQDFYNLIEVYLDAVFHPLLHKHHLEQEGWHYEMESADGQLQYKGVVFNEMKGAYSSPEGIIGRYTQQSLFPESHPYGVDSGGDPIAIPELTYEEFKAFHATYYHPTNSRIFFYGDDDPTERLRLLDEYLSDFEAIEVDSAVPLLPLVDQPARYTYPYAVEEGEQTDSPKLYVKLNWLLPEIKEPETKYALSILSHILSGTVGSPLRKALIDSGLGEDTLGGSFADYLRQPYFSVGMKGVAPENQEKVEQLILDTLRQLAEEGIAAETIEASLNTFEFRLRENNTGSYPRGLVLMLNALDTWLYEGDPLDMLRYEKPLQAIKEAVAAGNGYFENMLRTYLLENNHRTTVVLEPDAELNQKLEAAEQERLAAVRQSLSQEELTAIIENTAYLREIQEKPDDPAELAKIPTLTLGDLDKEIKTIPIDLSRMAGAEIVYHDLFTNGIAYFSIGMNLHVLPQELLPYLPLFSYALTEMGTEAEDYVQLTQRIGRTTGGIWPSTMVSSRQGTAEAVAWLSLRGKATMDHTADMLDIMRDVLLTVKLDNQARFRQMVLEEKAGQEAGIIPGGHSVAGSRLNARFDESGWINEQISGVEYLFFLRKLAEAVDKDWPSVLSKLQAIQRILVNRNNMLCNITLDAANWVVFQPQVAAFLEAFPTVEVKVEVWDQGKLPRYEGLAVPSQVNFVAKGTNVYDLGFTYTGATKVVLNYLRTSYLWERVRMQGGAYGVFNTFNSYSGVFAQLSYRDPNLSRTLEVFDSAADYLSQLEISQEEITKNIIGVIGSLDGYQLPDAKGYTSLNRYLLGVTDEERQQRRDEVLATSVHDFRNFAEVLAAVREHGAEVVVGSAETISQTNSTRPEKPFAITKLM